MRQADRIILNVLSNYGLTALGIVANLVMVPVVIHRLGRSGFGLATLLLAVLSVFDYLANTIGRALERKLPQALAANDQDQLGRTFNTGLMAFIGIGLLGSVCVLLFQDWLAGGAPEELGLASDARLSWWLLAAYMVVGYPWMCYQKALGALQRFDLIGVFSGGTTLARIGIVLLVFWGGFGSIGVFVGSLLVTLWVTNVLCRGSLRRLLPGLSESIRLVDRSTARDLGAFAAATLLIVIGNILVTQGYTIFVGKYLGLHDLGGLAAVLTIRTLLWTLVNNVAGVLTPAISHLEAHGANHHIVSLFLSGAKYSSMMAVMICGVPLMVAAPFLELWLGSDFKELDLLLYMMLIAQIPLAPALTAQQVLVGLGRVNVTGLIVFGRGISAILLAVAWLKWVDRSLEGTAACVFGMQLIGGLALFYYTSSVVKVSWLRATKEVMFVPVLLGILGGAATWLIISRFGTQGWWPVIAATAAGETAFLWLALRFGLTNDERARLRAFVGRVKGRLLPAAPAPTSAAEGEP